MLIGLLDYPPGVAKILSQKLSSFCILEYNGRIISSDIVSAYILAPNR